MVVLLFRTFPCLQLNMSLIRALRQDQTISCRYRGVVGQYGCLVFGQWGYLTFTAKNK